jgi:hypothetical protein
MFASQLDFYFPFFVFFYGVLILFMVDFPAFERMRERFVLPAIWDNPSGRKMLYVMTLFSGLWSLQNVLIT